MRAFTALLIGIVLAGGAAGQKKPAVKKPAKKLAVKLSEYLIAPFDTEREKLPPRFRGNDARKLIIPMLVAAKEIEDGCGTYEKSAQCQARMDRLYELDLDAAIDMSDTLAFDVGIDCTYVADTETFVCPPPFADKYLWDVRSIKRDSYIGRSVWGTKHRVRAGLLESVFIKPMPVPEVIRVRDVSPLHAARIHDSLRLLIIGEPLQPFARSHHTGLDPTVGRPVDIKADNYDLMLELREAWIYDYVTGEILVKQRRRTD